MKHYSLYIFSQDNCKPCKELKKHVETLPKEQQDELEFVPMKVQNSDSLTALASECKIELTPTLVVVHHDLQCDFSKSPGGGTDEFCDYAAEVIERIVGAKNIMNSLPSTLAGYTYSIEE